MLAFDLHFLKLAQGAQAHVEDGFGLHIGELEGLDQFGLGLIGIADDLDDLIKVQIRNEIALEHFEAVFDIGEAVFGAPDQHIVAMVEERLQHFAQVHHLWGAAHVEDVHVEPEARFEVCRAEHQLHELFGIDRAAAREEDQADIFGGFVPDIVEQRELLVLHQLGDLFDQPCLLHLIGHFGDDDLPGAAI